MSGLLVVDKPGGITSRDAVDRALRWFSRGTRMGHTGTLDPLATGVLVMCVGVATRLTEYVQRMDKTYRAGLLLGAHSDTDDVDGTVTAIPDAEPPERDTLMESLQDFVGEIEQVPPAYSAAKVTGRRAYDLARKGQDVMLKPRRIKVYGIDVLAYEYPRLSLEVRCGKGTYIRSLARDLGERLSCGALVETLRRTRVGPFQDQGAVGLQMSAEEARAYLLPLASAVADLPRVTLSAGDVDRLRHGQAIAWPNGGEGVPEIAIFNNEGTLVAVATVDRTRGLLLPAKVLPACQGAQ